MIAVIDYGAGNLFSVKNALDFLGVENCVAKDRETIQKADGLILPGVGAFPDAMEKLKEKDMAPVICMEAAKKPLLGICLGMQLLFESSCEFGETSGLGLLPGRVVPIDAKNLKIPHMGWTEGIEEHTYVYFVHSFRADTQDDYISCYTEYGERIPALVHKGLVYGTQYHPEKSGARGLKMLENFARLVEK